MKKELLTCAYCGGTLVYDKGHVWNCQYCGKSVVLSSSNKEDAITCSLKVEFDGYIREIEMAKECIIYVCYRKRTTLADPMPMYIEICSAENPWLLGPIANIGKGTIRLSYDVSSIKLSVEGKVQYKLSGPVERDRYLDSGASITIGSVKVTVL